jgi:kynurenine formamidase
MLTFKEGQSALHFEVLDLTHTLTPEVPTWNGTCDFKQRVIVDYAEACRVQEICLNAGTGTHLDAPLHFIPEGASVADMPLENFMVPLCVIKVTEKVHADYYADVDVIEAFEQQNGRIPAGALVIFHTGWDQHWSSPERYRGVDAQGQMHFPGITEAAAQALVERDVAGLGIDTLSPDCLNLNFPVHYRMLGAGKYIVENLTHCERLPAIGSYGLFLPLKTAGGTESVIRACALVLRKT